MAVVWFNGHGFRQVGDCAETYDLRVWESGHYWSVKPRIDCSAGDVPYAGKHTVLVEDTPFVFRWPDAKLNYAETATVERIIEWTPLSVYHHNAETQPPTLVTLGGTLLMLMLAYIVLMAYGGLRHLYRLNQEEHY